MLKKTSSTSSFPAPLHSNAGLPSTSTGMCPVLFRNVFCRKRRSKVYHSSWRLLSLELGSFGNSVMIGFFSAEIPPMPFGLLILKINV
jgi:hypothetical protein